MGKKKDDAQKALQTSVRKLKELLGIARTVRSENSERAGELGSAIRTAAENNHLHKRAFRAVVAEDRMEPEQLADFYDAQEYYRDALGLYERAESAPKLPALVGGTDTEVTSEAAE